MTPHASAIVLMAVASLAPAGAGAQEPAPDSLGVTAAAMAWLAQLDTRQMGAAFDSAAPLWRSLAGSADRWGEFVAMARRSFPDRPNRRLESVEFNVSIPGAPPGRYTRLAYRTGVTDAAVLESVVVQSVNGVWRVAMYGVQGA